MSFLVHCSVKVELTLTNDRLLLNIAGTYACTWTSGATASGKRYYTRYKQVPLTDISYKSEVATHCYRKHVGNNELLHTIFVKWLHCSHLNVYTVLSFVAAM